MGPVEAAKFDTKVDGRTGDDAFPRADWAGAGHELGSASGFHASPDLVVLETAIAAGGRSSWLRISVDNRLPAIQGPATPPSRKTRSFELERAFFVDAFYCRRQCDADTYNFAMLRSTVAARRAETADDRARHLRAEAPRASVGDAPRDLSKPPGAVSGFTAEDLGYDRQTPDRVWSYTVDGTLRRSTARRSATTGPASSRTGTTARS